MDFDAVIPGEWDTGILFTLGIDHAEPDALQTEPAALVEPERIQIVVGGPNRQTVDVPGFRLFHHGLKQTAANTVPAV